MRLEPVRCPSLPRLAWCAHLPPGASVATVFHGPWVESRPDRFFEGAWDGPFDAGRFDAATMFIGTGGTVDGDGVVFSTPTHFNEFVYSIRNARGLYLSNSVVFVLEASGESLDLTYPNYEQDFLEVHREGISNPDNAWVHTAAGNRIELHAHANVRIDRDGGLTRTAKARPVVPSRFAGYRALLADTTAAVLANAADPGRLQAFRPTVGMSRGYDAPAVAVIAAESGRCKDGFTLIDDPGDAAPDDNGREIGERLGLRVVEHRKRAYLDLPGMPEAEFLAFPGGTMIGHAGLDSHLAGTVLLSGRQGDTVWTKNQARILPLGMNPRRRAVVGGSYIEYRLRVGFWQFLVPYIGALDSAVVYGITMSPEMEPWAVGGDYDRPIPRRIVEEAGVPREWFGQHKMAGGFVIPKLLESNRPAAMALRAHYRKIQRRFASEPVLAHKRAERAPSPGPIPTAGAFRFGWAVEAIRPRYRSPRAG